MVALIKVYGSNLPADSVHVACSWLNPFDIATTSALVSGVLVAVFIYWGWDSLVSVNEETEDATRTPGIAAVISHDHPRRHLRDRLDRGPAFHGPQFLVDNSDDVLSALGTDVLGSPWDKLLIIAVLTSASASTQTTILPDVADEPLDGGARRDPEAVRAHPPAIPDAGRRPRSGWAWSRSSGTSA